MSDNIEKKNSQNISSTPNDDFLNWSDYDEEYEEEDNKNYNQPESKNLESTEIEDDTHIKTYNNGSNKDFPYSSNTYRKNYTSYGNRNNFINKKFNKQAKPFNKGYDNNNNYYNNNTYYNKKRTNYDFYNNNNKNFYKSNKDYNNYESKNNYKTVEKYNYDDNYDKKNFGDKNKGKKNGFNKYKNNDYNNNIRSSVPYRTREFNDNKNNNYKNNFKKFEKEEEIQDKEEEKLTKPIFYNSKINNNNKIIEEAPIEQVKSIKIEDFIQIENLVDNINIIVRDTYKNLKSMLNNKIEEEYGSLNINAETYVPKNKLLRNKMLNNNNNNNNYNYGPNYINNNNFNNFNGQNYYG